MNEKKVENIHTKPRGKGQCNPEQTCPEVPLVLYRFLILIDAYLSLWTKWQKKTLTHPVKFPALPLFTCFCLFCFVLFILKKENVIFIFFITLHIGRKFSHCVFTYLYIFIVSWGFFFLLCKHTDILSLRQRCIWKTSNLFCRNSIAMDLLSSLLCLIMPCSVCLGGVIAPGA